MGLRELAKRDIQQITSNKNEWATDLIFKAPTGEEATIQGLFTVISYAIDESGNAVNSKQGHVTFSEQLLVDQGYPVRKGNNNVNLKMHRVSAKDSAGILRSHVIAYWFPDETIGLIRCILGDI